MEHHHDYEIVSESSDGQVEVCRECKKRLTTTFGNKGRIDNIKYLKEHVRDTAQPNGRTGNIYKRYYAKNSSKN